MPQGRQVTTLLMQFVPSEYWAIFCAHKNINILNYPALRYDYDLAAGRDAIYGLFSFEEIKANGLPTGGYRLTYKGLWSRAVFHVDAYPMPRE